MKIHECARCEGCGYVTGAFRWEIPWSRWIAGDRDGSARFLEPHACPDCGGTGALIQFEAGEAVAESTLPSRRGLPQHGSYARHVQTLLRSRRPVH